MDTILETADEICYHESGHAVLGYLFGYRIEGIEVDPSEGSGCVSWDYESNVRPTVLELQNIPEIQARVICHCGGYACVSVLTGAKQRWRNSEDYFNAEQELAGYSDKKIIAAHIRSNYAHARNLLKKPQVRYAVQELASSLMWNCEEPNPEDCWYGEEMIDELPQEFWEGKSGLRKMKGKDAESIIRNALQQYARTHNKDVWIVENNAWELEDE